MKVQYLDWLLLFATLITAAVAQQTLVAPQPATGAGFVKRKNKLYVFGGEIYSGNSQVASGQFFVLDLSKQWKSDSPAWTRLPDGPPAMTPTAVMSPDDKIFMFNGRRRYHFDDNTWRDFNSLFSTFPQAMASYPVTLGTDGTVLVAGGAFGTTLTNQSYTIYSFATDSHVSTVYPAKATRPLIDEYYPGGGYRAAWSESLKSVVFFGGTAAHMDGPQTQVTMFYQAQTKQWSWKTTPNFQGTNYLGCMASSDDGNSIFWYGGYNPVATTQSFSVLDLASSSWASLPMNDVHRESAVCAVAGDYFLVWGGTIAGINRLIYDAGKPSTPVSIYQISKKVWVNEYIPSAGYAGPTTPPPDKSSPALPSSSSSPSSPTQTNPSNNSGEVSDNKSLNIGAIAGGAAGAVVVCAVIGFLVWRRKRQGPKHAPYHEHHSSVDDDPHNLTMRNKRGDDIHEAGWTPPPPSQIATNRSPQEPIGSDHAAPMYTTTPEGHYTSQSANPDGDHAFEMSQFNHATATDDPRYSGKSTLGGPSVRSYSSTRSPIDSGSSSLSSTPPSSSQRQKSRRPRNPQVLGPRKSVLQDGSGQFNEQRGPQYIPR